MPGLTVEARKSLRDFELDLKLEAERGCLAIAGPSGAGKSSFLRIVAGLLTPDRGRVAIGGDVWLDRGAGIDLAPEQRSCGFLFQDYALFPHLSALDNVAFGLGGRGRAERRALAGEWLERLGVGSLATAVPRELSGGERQRVALARAVAPEPRVLLLDEPFAALDASTAADAAATLATLLRDTGTLTLLVTHDFATAARFGDEIAIVDRGRVVQRDTADAVAARPGSAFVAGLVGASVLRGTARPGGDGVTVVELAGGDSIFSSDPGSGPVGAAVFPWEIELEPVGAARAGSARNRLSGRVVSTTTVGNRVRVAIETPQQLVAEVTAVAAQRLELATGSQVEAVWKATATRLTPLTPV